MNDYKCYKCGHDISHHYQTVDGCCVDGCECTENLCDLYSHFLFVVSYDLAAERAANVTLLAKIERLTALNNKYDNVIESIYAICLSQERTVSEKLVDISNTILTTAQSAREVRDE